MVALPRVGINNGYNSADALKRQRGSPGNHINGILYRVLHIRVGIKAEFKLSVPQPFGRAENKSRFDNNRKMIGRRQLRIYRVKIIRAGRNGCDRVCAVRLGKGRRP